MRRQPQNLNALTAGSSRIPVLLLRFEWTTGLIQMLKANARCLSSTLTMTLDVCKTYAIKLQNYSEPMDPLIKGVQVL